jgi:hypothetical protein
LLEASAIGEREKSKILIGLAAANRHSASSPMANCTTRVEVNSTITTTFVIHAWCWLDSIRAYPTVRGVYPCISNSEGVQMPSKGTANDWKSFRDRSSIYDMVTFITEQSERTFEDILRGLYEEYSPVGITEEELIRRLATLFWEREELCRFFRFKMEIRLAELNSQLPYAQFIARVKSRAIEFKKAKNIEEGKKFFSELDAAGQEGDDAALKWIEEYRSPEMSGNSVFEQIVSLPDVGPANGRDL